VIIERPRSGSVERPHVSVAMTCYNYGRFLPVAVSSVLTQVGVETDITIVDDCSTDDSLDVANDLAAGDHRVRVVSLPRNVGHIRATNEAFAQAGGPYVVKLDADDALPPGSLRRSVDLMTCFPDVALVYGRVDTFSDCPPQGDTPSASRWLVWSGEEWLTSRFQRPHNTIRQPEAMVRRAAIDEVGALRDDIQSASDFAMWLRLATAGSVGYVGGTVQGYYRVHGASLQQTVHAGLLFDLRQRILAFDNLFDERSASLTNPSVSRARVRKALADDAVRIVARYLDQGEVDESIPELLQTARSQDPSVIHSPAWLAVQARLRLAARHRLLTRLVPGAPTREFQDRLLRQRWRMTGI
jgi:glycosyltransferase involved in cell wall biosynthesis